MSGFAVLAALEWSRPQGGWSLLLAGAALLLVSRARRAPRVPTGTWRIWAEIAASAPRRASTVRHRLPPAAWWLIAAIACGAAALAGPSWRTARDLAGWTVVVDRSPSMYLPIASEGVATRMDQGLGRLLDWVREQGGARLRWIGPRGEVREGEAFPGDWLSAPAHPEAAPDWAQHDQPGRLWLTDALPRVAPAFAGVFASGGTAVPGPVAAPSDQLLVWDGVGIAAASRAGPPARVAIALETPEPIRRMVAAWAAARGLECVQGPDAEAALQVLAPSAAGADAGGREVRAGRDGWWARGRVETGGAALRGAAWLTAMGSAGGEERVLVAVSPGRIEVALTELEEPRGDPVAFALSWGRLLDRTARLPAGVIALRERLAAGAGGVLPAREPGEQAGLRRGGERSVELTPFLALLAALLALGYLRANLRRA